MTSPEVNVGAIVAKVSLDTSDLRKSESESAASLKRTSGNLAATATSADKVQKSVDKASTAIKRHGDATVETIRRTSSAQQQADRDAVRRGSTSGAAGGAVAGAIFGQFASQALGSIGDGKGGRRDGISAIGQGAFTGGALGATIGPVGAGFGALAGAGIGLGTHFGGVLQPGLAAQDAKVTAAMAAQDAADARHVTALKRQAQFTDDLGRAQLRAVDSAIKLRDAHADIYDPKQRAAAQARVAGIVSPLVGGSFDEHQRGTVGDVGKAVDKLSTANRQLADAQDRLDRLRQPKAGASRSSLLSAQASVLSAQDALNTKGGNHAVEVLRLAAAEQRLADLRGGGKTNTAGLAKAERDLAAAREKVKAAEKGVTAAGLSVSLTPKTLLDRLRTKSADVQALDIDTRKLVAKGLRAPVIEELLSTEKTAPGTVHKVVTTITQAQVKAMNQQEVALQKAAADLIQAPIDRAYADARRDAEKRAQELVTTTRSALISAFSGAQTSPNSPTPGLLPGPVAGRPQIPNDPLAPLFPGLGNGATRDPGNPGGHRDSVTFTGPVTLVAPNGPALIAASAAEVRKRGLAGGGVNVT